MKSISKHLNLLGSLFLVALIFTISATSVSASAAALRADIVKCDPNPAQIGQYVNVWIKIENIGNTRAKDVSVELIPSYPFSLDAGDDAVRNIGILSIDRHASLEYNLYVDENARPGTRSIKVRYQDDEGTAWAEETLDIWVGSGSDTFDSKGTIVNSVFYPWFPGNHVIRKVRFQEFISTTTDLQIADTHIYFSVHRLCIAQVNLMRFGLQFPWRPFID